MKLKRNRVTDVSSHVFVIVSSKPWYFGLKNDLKAKTGCRVFLISEKEQFTFEKISQLNPRYIFIPHWSHIIPKEIHESFECIIFHMTDLPYGRGGSPLQNLIHRGHKDTQISALRCTSELDSGPIYLKRPLDLRGSASEIFHRAAKVIKVMIEEIIDKDPDPEPQQGEPTIFRRRTPQESNMCEAQLTSLGGVFDFIRMLDAPTYPLAFVESGDFLIEFSHARLFDNSVEARVTIRSKDDFL
jgi:methionyl-tRNA formyltransferase